MFSPSGPGDRHRNRSVVSLLQEEHVHQWEIRRRGFLLQAQHTHPVSARRTRGKPSLLSGPAAHRLPRCYQEHQAPLYEHKVSTHASLTIFHMVYSSLLFLLLCLNICKQIEVNPIFLDVQWAKTPAFIYEAFFKVFCILGHKRGLTSPAIVTWAKLPVQLEVIGAFIGTTIYVGLMEEQGYLHELLSGLLLNSKVK